MTFIAMMTFAPFASIPDRIGQWNDFAGILPDKKRAEYLEMEFFNFKQDEKIDCCVVTVKHLGEERLSSFVDRLVNKWKPISSSALIVVVRDELSFSVRLGDDLKNAENEKIANAILYDLESAQTNQQLRSAVAGMLYRLRGLRKNPK